ncbi:hypothetical protein [Candidatus Mycoplasma haematominutum]|uniref:hypothetical protein n=1 Tax=Candidatus Mycoplasma haematominutum TaxID=209446 RepID=UPI0003072D22|nr:hypothetical protein [Candidatus Mycoplasma haematominutum]
MFKPFNQGWRVAQWVWYCERTWNACVTQLTSVLVAEVIQLATALQAGLTQLNKLNVDAALDWSELGVNQLTIGVNAFWSPAPIAELLALTAHTLPVTTPPPN